MRKLFQFLRVYQFHGVIFSMCFITLLYMHYAVLLDKSDLTSFSYIENICALFIDCCFVLIIPLLFIKKRFYYLFIPLVLTQAIALVHIWYSRYFYTYLPPSLFGEFNNLDGLGANVIAALRPADSILLALLALTIVYYVKQKSTFKEIEFKSRFRVALVMAVVNLCLIIGLVGIAKRSWPDLRYKYTLCYRHSPAESTFKYGLVYSSIIQSMFNGQDECSPEDVENIKNLLNGPQNAGKEASSKNLIFILVESLISYPINMEVDSFEITPNLNQFIAENNYYNKNVSSQTKLGKSSDGQFIYLTGVLPKEEGVTVIDYFNNTFMALPQLLKEGDKKYTTSMVIPTSAQMWRQNGMCIKYGIDSLYSRKSYPDNSYSDKWLNDKRLFEYAVQVQERSRQPFMSVVLTSSTHSPYDHYHEKYPINFPGNYPEEFKIYLSNVHYMDKYLGEYIETLKEKDLYNNSLIVIVSDHDTPNDWFKLTGDMQVPTQIPLLVLNSEVTIDKPADYPMTQVDVFPTILDLMGIKSKWRGVGNSMLTPDSIINSAHEVERRERMQEISDVLLNSDYWKSAK